jgi:N-acetylglucosaminyl-diphospho-decaprenol L-rhamnosyltransferase
VDDVVAHHQPTSAPRAWRTQQELRNRLWSAWLRRPLPRAAALTVGLIAGGRRRSLPALMGALRGLPWIARERRVLPAHVERSLRLLDG